MLNTQQYLEMRHEALKNDRKTPSITRDYDLLLWDTAQYTDWQKELIGGTSEYSNLNLNVSGGNESVHYLIGEAGEMKRVYFPVTFLITKSGCILI